MKKINFLTFVIVCTGFSLFIMVVSLYKSIALAGVNSFITDTRNEIERLKTENEVLRVRVESRLSLEEIDEYARGRLGMRPASPEQIFFAELQG